MFFTNGPEIIFGGAKSTGGMASVVKLRVSLLVITPLELNESTCKK